MSETAAFETPADAGKGEAGEVRLWLEAIRVQRKVEADWREKAVNAIKRYRDEENREGRRFNILFANTQTVMPAIYNSTPVPDIRRRFGDADEIGKLASKVLERSASYLADAYDFDACMRAVCFDMVMVGRGVARVKQDDTLDDEGGDILDQSVTCEYVDWRDFIRGPGRRWNEVPWIAFEHRLTREELARQFGAVGAKMPLDVVQDGADRDESEDKLDDVFMRGTVHEIWNKQAREVLFIAPTVPDRVLKRMPDPLGLREFWPIPRPVHDVPETGSLVPLVPFELYRDQAEELDRVTARITALVNVLRYRGFYAADIGGMTELAQAKDGEMVPIQDAQQFMGATGGGGLDRAFFFMPIETLVAVVRELVVHREQIKQVIYEITGLSDILRGATQASETATAQQLKSEWGSLRIQDRQAEVQRFARDLLRIKCEIVAEHFEPRVLAMMTGVEIPTAEEKAQAMAAMQQGVQDERLAKIAQSPTWEDVTGVLRSDAMRSYRVDIETDSTIRADVGRFQENAARFVEGFAAFIQGVGPAVVQGFMPRDVAADVLVALARNYKLGRQAEDALERFGQQSQQPQQPAPDPAAAEIEKARIDADTAMKKAALDAETKKQIEAEKLATDERVAMYEADRRLEYETRQLAFDAQRRDAERLFEREKLAMQSAAARDDREQSAALEREKMAASERQTAEAARAKAEPESKAAAQIAVLAEGVQQVGAAVGEVAQRVDGLAQQVATIAEDMAAPVEADRGPDGRIMRVRKGKRVANVMRGPAGEAMGLA